MSGYRHTDQRIFLLGHNTQHQQAYNTYHTYNLQYINPLDPAIYNITKKIFHQSQTLTKDNGVMNTLPHRSIAITAIFLLFAIANSSAGGTCSESSGVCVCSGSCPSFTQDWSIVDSNSIDDTAYCAAAKGEDSLASFDGSTVTINGTEYTAPFEACPSTPSSGMMMGSMGFVITVAIMAVMLTV